MSSPALGMLELSLVARGVVVADAVLKKAEVAMLASRPVSGGKHIVLFRGEVAEVEESMDAGREAASGALVDELLLPMADEQIWPLVPEPVHTESWEGPEESKEAVAIVETATACSAIGAADAAAKAAEVRLRDMRLAVGLSGKAFFSFSGPLHDVEASADASRTAAQSRLLAIEVIASPAGELRGRLLF